MFRSLNPARYLADQETAWNEYASGLQCIECGEHNGWHAPGCMTNSYSDPVWARDMDSQEINFGWGFGK